METILRLISNFIENIIYPLPLNLRKNNIVIHYYNEIIRFWSKLNFIIRRTYSDFEHIDVHQKSKFLYATYRILWEDATEEEVVRELKKIDINFLIRLKSFSWDKAIIHKDEEEKLSIIESIPSFMIKHLIPVMEIDFLRNNVNFMNRTDNSIEITIRVNKLKNNMSSKDVHEQIKGELIDQKINYRKDNDLPEMYWILLSQKNKVVEHSLYQKGFLIFQDKASATVVKALSPKEEDRICDMCAAPGIKTSLIAQYMNNNGQIIAGDFLLERIKMMKILLDKLNVLNTEIINTDSIIFPIRFQNYFDKILLDAPCTGSGNLFLNPELKWRQNKKFLRQNLTLQRKLIESALNLLKPGGIFIYSTCSLYPEEGEYLILDFLDYLEPLDLPKWVSPSYIINNKTIPGTGRLFPSIHKTQGFFIGKFKKK
ncbi:MAG: RsmB/NOP family class I SAM-dependent RNA methyltransferase [Candidatus Hermodarchaeota archaeon]